MGKHTEHHELVVKNRHILALTALFLLVSFALETFGVWGMLKLPEPTGYLFQGLLFLGLWFVLQNTLFAPYLKVMDLRVEETEGQKQKAKAAHENVDQMKKEYQSSLEKSLLDSSKVREEIALSAEKVEADMIQQAKDQAQALALESARKLALEESSARSELNQFVNPIAEEMILQVLGEQARAEFVRKSEVRS